MQREGSGYPTFRLNYRGAGSIGITSFVLAGNDNQAAWRIPQGWRRDAAIPNL